MSENEQNAILGSWCQSCAPCQSHCYLRCHIENGIWTKTEGCTNACNNGQHGSTSLCAKGVAAHESIKASGRILYPMRRIGPKGPGAKFTRISWKEALGTIASTLLEQKRLYGPESFGILSPQMFPPLAFLGRRLLNVHGSPNYLHSAICFTQRKMSMYSVLGCQANGMANNMAPTQLDKTKLLVSWGANPENAAINRGGIKRRLRRQREGMQVIDIRPMRDALADKADLWLPVRPGTDLALALGILHVIVRDRLYDAGFVAEWCHGFEELREHLGQFTPEWAEHRCGIDASLIERTARLMGTVKPMGIICGNGVGDQSRDGHWTVVAIQLIGALTGNFGIPGGGSDQVPLAPMVAPFRMPDTLSSRMPASEEDLENGWKAGTSKLVAPEFPQWLPLPGHDEPTSTYFGGLMSVLTGKPYPLRCVLAQATNPLTATRQPKLVEKALEKLDMFIAMDMYWNPSCDYADIVLPAASQFECSHQLGMQNVEDGTFIAISQKLATPPGEAMSDWEFYLKLAEALGYGDDFWGGDIEKLLEEMVEPTGYSLEQLRQAPDGIFIPRDGQHLPQACARGSQEPDYARLLAALPGGKVQCANDFIGGKPSVVDGKPLPRLPIYQGPPEGIAETPELAREYPLIFSDVHAYHTSTSSCLGGSAHLRALQPYPWVKINPKTAERYGISQDDWVRVESPHGWVVLKAQITECISPEVLMAKRGWWQSCDELGLPGYGCLDGGSEVNVLYSTDETALDRFHSSIGKQTLVRIGKWNGSDIDA